MSAGKMLHTGNSMHKHTSCFTLLLVQVDCTKEWQRAALFCATYFNNHTDFKKLEGTWLQSHLSNH